MALDAEARADWLKLLQELDTEIAPVARERGYSRDALLIAWFLNNNANAMRDLTCALIEDDEVEDGDLDEGEEWKGRRRGNDAKE
jgi:hypothetical protein